MLEVCSPNNLEKRLPNQEAFPHWSQVIYGGCRSEAAELKTGHDIRVNEDVCPMDPMGIHMWTTRISSYSWAKADYAQRKSPADQELILAFLYSQVRKTCWHIFCRTAMLPNLEVAWASGKSKRVWKTDPSFSKQLLAVVRDFPARTAVGVWLICLGKSSTSFGDGAWGKSRPRGALQQRLVRSSSHPFTNFCLAWERASP